MQEVEEVEEVKDVGGRRYSKMYNLYSDEVTEQYLYDLTSGALEVRQIR